MEKQKGGKDLSKYFNSIVNARIGYLASIINEKEKSLTGSPAGTLRVSGSEEHPSLYYMTEYRDTNGRYINKNNISLARALAQKDYDQKIIGAAEKELKCLDKLIRIENASAEDIYDALSPARRALVEPVRLPDDEYIARWLESKKCEPMGFDENDPEILTKEGYRVRSKSEQLWADSFFGLEVPHVFEPKLFLKGHGWVRPDFVGLNVRLRKEIWVEHLGMMDDPAYSDKNVKKVHDYERNGFILGDTLLISIETKKHPLEAKAIEELIKKHFL